MTTADTILKITSLSKTFNAGTVNEVKALKGISCEIARGNFVILVGTNGSGKSTLLNAVAGTFLPDSGRIYLSGKNVTRWPEHRRAMHFGRVFQNPFTGTAPDMTIAENFALAAKRGMSRGLGKALSKENLALFEKALQNLKMGLEDRLYTPIGKLSGGQRQALTLLMATWNQPDVLLLDEHTAALDPKTAGKIVEWTQKIVESGHLTTLMVTHSMQQAISLGDRILMLHQGKIVRDIPADEKKTLKTRDLLNFFDEIRRKEQIDQSLASLIRENYI